MFKMYFHGSSNPNPGRSGCGVIIYNDNNEVIAEISEFIGKATNNQAEYNALILGLEKAKELGIERLSINGDSKLVINQLNGVWNCNDPALRILQKESIKLLYSFNTVELSWVKRIDNSIANELSKQALNESKDYQKVQSADVVPISNIKAKSMSVNYYQGIGFTVIDNNKLYAINLTPLSCSCGANASCQHIDAAIEFSQRKHKC